MQISGKVNKIDSKEERKWEEKVEKYFVFMLQPKQTVNNILMSNIVIKKPGQHRFFTLFCLVVFFQFILYSMSILSIYAVLTLNWNMIIILGSISFLQSYTPKSELFVYYVKKYIHPLWYYKSYTRIYDQPINDDEKCLFALHPHSVITYSAISSINVDSSKLSTMIPLGSRFILAVPIFGFLGRLWGVQGVDPANMKRLIKQGKTIGIVPGGYEEAVLTTNKQLRVFLKHRKGFVKYALRYGYTIYPVLTYNEHTAFKTLDCLLKLRMFLTKFKIPAVFFGGGFLQVFFPFNVDIVTVIGKGIKRHPDNKGEPTNEEVEQLHEEYMKDLKQLHEKYKKYEGNVKMIFY